MTEGSKANKIKTRSNKHIIVPPCSASPAIHKGSRTVPMKTEVPAIQSMVTTNKERKRNMSPC